MTKALQSAGDDPADQNYIVNEFNRANKLMGILSQRQQDVTVRKLELETEIMAKGGEDDGDLWEEYKEC